VKLTISVVRMKNSLDVKGATVSHEAYTGAVPIWIVLYAHPKGDLAGYG